MTTSQQSAPQGGTPKVELVGPIEYAAVVLDGFKVPYLTADPTLGEHVHLTLDNRFGIDLDVRDSERIIEFVADCIAVAMGYTCHPRAGWDGPIKSQPFQRMTSLGGLVSEGGDQ